MQKRAQSEDAASAWGAFARDPATHAVVALGLIGPEAKIREVAGAAGVDLSAYRIVEVENTHAAAETAVRAAKRPPAPG